MGSEMCIRDRLKSQGSAVDQAASLVMTAREEGHRDPDWGMKLLDEADDDIERSLSLADDVEIIKNDALQAVETAEEIAPIVKRPRKAWDMGQREVELGSLREGEALFRQAKKRAMEVIEWWEKAEEAIREASALLSNSSMDTKTSTKFCRMQGRNCILRIRRKHMNLQW